MRLWYCVPFKCQNLQSVEKFLIKNALGERKVRFDLSNHTHTYKIVQSSSSDLALLMVLYRISTVNVRDDPSYKIEDVLILPLMLHFPQAEVWILSRVNPEVLVYRND